MHILTKNWSIPLCHFARDYRFNYFGNAGLVACLVNWVDLVILFIEASQAGRDVDIYKCHHVEGCILRACS